MKTNIVLAVLTALVMPLMAQETNTTPQKLTDTEINEPMPREQRVRPEPTPEQKAKFKEHRLRLLEKALNEIGVTEEQREQIIALQDAHMETMKANWKRMNDARRKLSELQDRGASEKEIDEAIQEIADAQTEQLKTLVRNRMEMERILGKEKNEQLMEKARKQFREHGRRPGAGMPPRPEFSSGPSDDRGTGLPDQPADHTEE